MKSTLAAVKRQKVPYTGQPTSARSIYSWSRFPPQWDLGGKKTGCMACQQQKNQNARIVLAFLSKQAIDLNLRLRWK